MNDYYADIAPFVSCLDAFVHYIRKKGSLDTTANGFPKSVDIFAINELFADNEKQLHLTPTANYKQAKFVKYLFETTFQMGLWEKARNAKGKEIIKLNEEALAKYEVLDSEEKYVSFLQAFWCDFEYDSREIDVYSLGGLMLFLSFIATMPQPNMPKVESDRIAWGDKHPNFWADNGYLVDLFANLGFWKLEKNMDIKPKNSYDKQYLKNITITNLGIEIAKIITNKLPLLLCNQSIDKTFFDNNDDATKYPHFDFTYQPPLLKEPFMTFFKSLFPTIEVVLAKPAPEPTLEGNYYFKVSLAPKLYRIIGLHSSQTMEDLHLAIQNAYNFGNDHLYLFSMDLKGYFSNHIIHDPLDSEGNRFANETTIDNLLWKPQHEFLYIFDFGNDWEFLCELHTIAPDEKPLKTYKIVEKVGKAPKQYGDCRC